MSKVEISFQIPSLPPPHAYALYISLEENGSSAKVLYQKEFLGRDSITKEEIEEEGYSTDDDLSWEGTIPAIWFRDTLALTRESEFTSEPQENSICHIEHQKINGFATNVAQWEYLIEELFQALLEKEEEEAPLNMKITINNQQWLLKASFLNKVFSINNQEIAWKELRNFLISLEEIETSEKDTQKMKSNKAYISFDGESHSEIRGKKSAESLSRTLHDMLLGN